MANTGNAENAREKLLALTKKLDALRRIANRLTIRARRNRIQLLFNPGQFLRRDGRRPSRLVSNLSDDKLIGRIYSPVDASVNCGRGLARADQPDRVDQWLILRAAKGLEKPRIVLVLSEFKYQQVAEGSFGNSWQVTAVF
jgi:hypothetical protein